MGSYYGSSSTRGLWKRHLGGVIFGSNETTINECLCKKLFGQFLFGKRTLLGIFEAASSGQMNIDPCAWTCEGSQKTLYPAQVQIRVKLQCKVLTENQFKPIIIDNYYTSNHLWFELDRAQTNRLLSLLSSLAFSYPRTTLTPNNTTKRASFFPSVEFVSSHLKSAKNFPVSIQQTKTFSTLTDKDVICMRLKELTLNRKLVAPLSADCKDESVVSRLTMKKKEDSLSISSKTHPMISQLILKVGELMASKATQKAKINHLEEKMAFFQQKLAKAQTEIKKLKGICNMSELETCVSLQEYNDLKANEVSLADDPILLVGGYGGGSWLSSLDCYSPSQNLTKSLNPMNTERCYVAVSKLDGELYVFGGGICGQWFDTGSSPCFPKALGDVNLDEKEGLRQSEEIEGRKGRLRSKPVQIICRFSFPIRIWKQCEQSINNYLLHINLTILL
ncbi:hypothetical protein L1987_75867 [Smallanthus sonchifolius]|uniref:Uncharacterized protein n=1 Tax=Smallanthus sonchifolius TaxID=185202 RepID=A0ACB9A6Y5_9ASTR|nr:hypothetical protein L1987_75867 [Smallanthus sonchifolius]